MFLLFKLQNSKTKSMKTKFLTVILIILLIVSCSPNQKSQEIQEEIIATYAVDYTLPKWVSLGSPPHNATQIISIKDITIWVQSSNNEIYSTTLNFGCDSHRMCGEWDIATTPPENTRKPWEPTRGKDCPSLNQNYSRSIVNPEGIMKECIYAPVPGIDTVGDFFFALMSDGTILFLDNTPPFVAK